MKKKNEKPSVAKLGNSKHITTTTTMKTTITTKTKIPVELLQNMESERPYSANFKFRPESTVSPSSQERVKKQTLSRETSLSKLNKQTPNSCFNYKDSLLPLILPPSSHSSHPLPSTSLHSSPASSLPPPSLKSTPSHFLPSSRPPPIHPPSSLLLTSSSSHLPSSSSNLPPYLSMPNKLPTQHSSQKSGVIKSYAVNTNQGIVRNYNEDRVSIILNVLKPIDRSEEFWPKCSFFGVYDGHGGEECADFLRDNLHTFVVESPNFPWNPKVALVEGFGKGEEAWKKRVWDGKMLKDRSGRRIYFGEGIGGCALVVMIVGDMCYIANVGDSRAIMSGEGGSRIFALSKDHKPMEESEFKRITNAGGKIYQSKSTNSDMIGGQSKETYGPCRILPGRLSVSRTFGDFEAKIVELGGNPNVIVALPEIKCFQITHDHDFIILASDGIYDKLTNKEIIDCVWNTNKTLYSENIHQASAEAVESIMKNSITKKTVDNITVVLIGFSGYKKNLFSKNFMVSNHSVDDLLEKTVDQINSNLSFELNRKDSFKNEEFLIDPRDMRKNEGKPKQSESPATFRKGNNENRKNMINLPKKDKNLLVKNTISAKINLSHEKKGGNLNLTRKLEVGKPLSKK